IGPASRGTGAFGFLWTLSWCLPRRLPWTFLLGALLSLAAVVLFGWALFRALPYVGTAPASAADGLRFLCQVACLVVFATGLAWTGGVLACLARLCVLLVRTAQDKPYLYGICPGTTPVDSRVGQPALTDWLDRKLEELAGRIEDGRLPEAPLT